MRNDVDRYLNRPDGFRASFHTWLYRVGLITFSIIILAQDHQLREYGTLLTEASAAMARLIDADTALKDETTVCQENRRTLIETLSQIAPDGTIVRFGQRPK